MLIQVDQFIINMTLIRIETISCVAASQGSFVHAVWVICHSRMPLNMHEI
jgi:hypothetical protein